MTSTSKFCAATRVNGEECNAYALSGSRFCWWHCPDALEARQEARSRGGRARHGRDLSGVGEEVAGREFRSLSDMVDVLSLAIRSTLSLEPSVSRNRALGYLARCWSDVFQVGELEQRLSRLEREL